MPRDDSELVECWQRGDPDAFEAIVRRWEAPIGRFLSRMVGNSEDARDLTQEVFLRVHQARGNYHENGAFPAWLYQIALNAARDAARRHRKAPNPIEFREKNLPQKSPEVESQDKELGDAVEHILASLPDTLREVLILRHYEGVSFAEMSRVLKTPASTLKSRFSTALMRVRERLRELGFLFEDHEK